MDFFRALEGALEGAFEDTGKALEGALEDAGKALEGAGNKVKEVAENVVKKQCYLKNDTKYNVKIVDYDGTRNLYPGTTQHNYILAGFSIDLIMFGTNNEERKVNLHSNDYENRTHNMSHLFKDTVKEYNNINNNKNTTINVKSVEALWKFCYNHPGDFTKEIEVEKMHKNTLKSTSENTTEFGLEISTIIKGIEINPSFKQTTKITDISEFESSIKKTSKETYSKKCYIWQEIIIVKSDKFTLEIPTNHIESTETNDEPGKDKFIYLRS